jgi:hypothetical protein
MCEEEIERHKEHEITCPYCGYEFQDSWDYGLKDDGDEIIEDCPECGKNFHVSFCVDVNYTTKGLCEENNEDHNWNYFDNPVEGKENCKGRNCLTCGKYEFDRFKKSRGRN